MAKASKTNVGKLEPAADAQNAADDAATGPTVAAAAGQAAEAGTTHAAGGDQKPADGQNAGQVQGAADAGTVAADAEKPEPEAPMTVPQLAREVASLACLFASREPIDIECFARDNVLDEDEAEIMADFVRQWPEAPVLAMWQHLRLAKRYPDLIPNNQDMLVLNMFRNACRAGFYFEQLEAVEKAAKSSQADMLWPGDLAFQVEAGPFDPTGLSPRR